MDFKGISTELVPQARTAINQYVDGMENYLDKIKNPNVSVAFRGEYAAAVQEFTNNVIEAVKQPLQMLRAFEEKMEAAKVAYIKHDTEVKNSISGTSTQ